jgi:hsp70-interacting protein
MPDHGNNPWAWAGLLKWSLDHVDGTADNSDLSPMSPEDREFLENVMKEGIVDEADRMKFILTEATNAMEYYRSLATAESSSVGDPPITEGALEDLLQELRDIVEQIDYARAFCSLQGLPFLLGCVQQPEVPESIRQVCLGIMSTAGQNNPPVQQMLLEMGALKTLSDLFFEDTTSNAIKAKIMQSMGSIVRNHELSENVFENLPQAPDLFLTGLDPASASQSLQSKTLFFLRALVTSDLAKSSRIYTFQNAIIRVADSYLDDAIAPELREMAVAFLENLLVDRKGGATILLQRKNQLAALGVKRIASLRGLTGEDREFAQVELDHWENFMVLLSRAEPEKEEPPLPTLKE